jgi:polygalacturonase
LSGDGGVWLGLSSNPFPPMSHPCPGLSRLLSALVLFLAAAAAGRAADAPPAVFDVRAYGATGDGKTIDSGAVNQAIAAAAAAGGGTVRFPAGIYVCYTLHLQSNVALYLDAGSTIEAAPQPAGGAAGYDLAEPNVYAGKDNVYQDYGHSHFHNSLIVGENVENISILGPGRIYGHNLFRDGGTRPGEGNKAIALKLCRNVNLKDFTLFEAGWFSLLATGVDNLTLDNLHVDTNRDGFDIDCCRNVRVSNCTVNSPRDDGICLKSSFGLGFARATENVTITNCEVSGYDMGSFLDGTYKVNGLGGTGRIKFGTESNGGFKNISISNCVFDHCSGLAIESVDGGIIEDVTVSNLAMRSIANAPIFIRLGHRMRGPADTPVGAIRRVSISNIVASNVSSRSAILIAGTTGHPIEDVRLSDIRIIYQGGGTADQAAINPPQDEAAFYPEPSKLGVMPGYGMFARHMNGLTLRDVDVSFAKDDARPPVVLDDVTGIAFDHFKAQRAAGVPVVVGTNVHDYTAQSSPGLAEGHLDTLGAAAK